jgi:hypothetical protein
VGKAWENPKKMLGIHKRIMGNVGKLWENMGNVRKPWAKLGKTIGKP